MQDPGVKIIHETKELRPQRWAEMINEIMRKWIKKMMADWKKNKNTRIKRTVQWNNAKVEE